MCLTPLLSRSHACKQDKHGWSRFDQDGCQQCKDRRIAGGWDTDTSSTTTLYPWTCQDCGIEGLGGSEDKDKCSDVSGKWSFYWGCCNCAEVWFAACQQCMSLCNITTTHVTRAHTQTNTRTHAHAHTHAHTRAHARTHTAALLGARYIGWV